MFEEASELCQDVSILRRLSFATSNLNKETPRYWDFVKAFGFMSASLSAKVPDSKEVETFMQNLEYLDNEAMEVDHNLFRQMQKLEGFDGHPLGIVLISPNRLCRLRGGNLLLRTDRPSFPIIYSEVLGTISGTHFRKYCQNNHKGCSFTQHYGFYSKGNEHEVVYNHDCFVLPYFLSTNMTAFDTKCFTNFQEKFYLAN